MSVTVQPLTIPNIILDYWQPRPYAERKVLEAAVLALVGEDRVTISRGAELLGLPMRDFLDLMHRHGLTEWDDSPKEVADDVTRLHSLLNAQS